MKYRKLGRDGPVVSAISMGRGSRPVRAGDPLEQDFNAAIRRAYELGINFFDSSDAYWGTRHETLLGRGLLTGRIKQVDDLPANDRRRRHPRFAPENLAHNVKLVECLEALAKARGASSAQVALAWILAQGEFIVPIPGSNHAPHVEQNAAAADLELTGDELRQLDEMFAIGAGAGARYRANVLKGVGL